MTSHETNATGARIIRFARLGLQRRFPAISVADAYWEALRGTRAMPERSEIDPRGLGDALAHSFLLDRVAPGVARIRLSGTHLTDLMGMDVRGMPLTVFAAPAARGALADVIEDVTTRPAVATLNLVSERGLGRPPLVARLLLAPLGSADGPGSRLFGALEALGEVGRTPRRFTVTEAAMRQIEAPGWAGATVVSRAPAAETRAASGFAEAQATYADAKRRAETPTLTLVKSV